MKFFLDENFPKSATKLLEFNGHQVFDIRSTPNEGATDIEIFEMAQKRNAIFLTTDKDFFHTVPYMFKIHCGVIVISLRQPNSRKIIDKLKKYFTHFERFALESKVVLIKDNNCIITD